MYVILINNDNTMTTVKKQRIVQRSKLVDDLFFLVHPNYNGHDMSKSTVLMEYILPVSKEYESEILELSTEKYEEYLKYQLPIDTKLTREAGDIEILLSFIYVDIDGNGKSIQQVRKIIAHSIYVDARPDWSNIIPDSALSIIDQRIIKTDAQIRALNEMSDIFDITKADNITYDKTTNELQLLSGNNAIGDKVEINCESIIDENGVPVVNLDKGTGGTAPNSPFDDEKESDIVEF